LVGPGVCATDTGTLYKIKTTAKAMDRQRAKNSGDANLLVLDITKKHLPVSYLSLPFFYFYGNDIDLFILMFVFANSVLLT
jgi:hypothetical protein